jgi:mono/diheme cytochrome c family protein
MRWLAILLLAAGTAHADGAGPSFGNPNRFTEIEGAAVYGAACAGCHMPNGAGAVGAGAYPSLVADPRLASSAYPVALVLRGHGAMPPFGRTLTDAQIAAVVGYIRTNFGNAYAGPLAAADVAAAR